MTKPPSILPNPVTIAAALPFEQWRSSRSRRASSAANAGEMNSSKSDDDAIEEGLEGTTNKGDLSTLYYLHQSGWKKLAQWRRKKGDSVSKS
jgi:hypothetical protein